MKRVGRCMAAAFGALLSTALAWAESPAEYQMAPWTPPASLPRPASRPAPRPVPIPAPRLVPPPAPRPARPMFAPEAAATARPLEPHEREERRLLKEFAAASRFQVDAARLAQAKSTSSAVRSLATALTAHHQPAGNDVLRMLHQRGLAAPMLENTQRRVLTRLARLQGAKFDREYVQAAAGQTQAEIALCEAAGGVVQDGALANWIARTLPALRAHADDAERLAAGWHAPAHPAPRGARHRSGVSVWNSR